MATVALWSRSHVFSFGFITNGALTQWVRVCSVQKGAGSEKTPVRPPDHESTLKPKKRKKENIKRNLIVGHPPTQGRQSLRLFISDRSFSNTLFDSGLFISLKRKTYFSVYSTPSILYMAHALHPHLNAFIFNHLPWRFVECNFIPASLWVRSTGIQLDCRKLENWIRTGSRISLSYSVVHHDTSPPLSSISNCDFDRKMFPLSTAGDGVQPGGHEWALWGMLSNMGNIFLMNRLMLKPPGT